MYWQFSSHRVHVDCLTNSHFSFLLFCAINAERLFYLHNLVSVESSLCAQLPFERRRRLILNFVSLNFLIFFFFSELKVDMWTETYQTTTTWLHSEQRNLKNSKENRKKICHFFTTCNSLVSIVFRWKISSESRPFLRVKIEKNSQKFENL